MANIFNFPTKKGDTSKEGFLQEASELVQFDATGRGVEMSDVQIPAHLLPSPKDWSNQELASIYRVKRLLDAAGVPNHVERSLSDEGDPWCVFCTDTGDVFIHLCRLDGLYVLDSPNLAQPIHGSDFADLISQFSQGALRNSEKAAKARRRLIKLERGGKIFLHPSVLLAALIWSIYLNSEDLVMFMPEEGEDGFDSDAAVALLSASSDAFSLDDVAAEKHFTHSIATPDKIITAPSPVSESDSLTGKGTPFYKDVAVKAGLAMAPSAIAVGLSSIAIAYGFMSDTYFDNDAPIQTELSLGQDGELQGVAEGTDVAIQTPRAETPFDLAAVLDAVFDHGDAGQGAEDLLPITEHSAQIDVASLLEVALKMPATAEAGFTGPDADMLLDEGLEGGQKIALIIPQKLAAPDSDPSVVIIASEIPNDGNTALPDILPLPAALYSLADLRDSFSGQLMQFVIGDTTLEASFDIASLTDETNRLIDVALDFDFGTNTGTDVAMATPDPMLSATSDMLTSFFQRPGGGTLINENAINFVLHLMDKVENVQIIARANEITLIDFAAFDAAQGEVYAMGWTLEHGGTVQTIGLKADFMEFDLIA